MRCSVVPGGIDVLSPPVRPCGLSAARTKFGVCQFGNQPFGVKDRFVLEHEIDGPGDLDGQHGVGLEFITVHPCFQSLGQRTDDGVIALGDDGRFAKGPAQIGVAQLGTAQALDLASTGHGPFDQPTVGEEIFDRGKAADVADLVKDDGTEVFADAGDRLEQRVIARGDSPREPLQLGFDDDDLGVEMADHGHLVLESQLTDGMIFVGEDLLLPEILVEAVAADDSGAVVCQLMGMDAGQQIGALPNQVGALTEQSANGPFIGGINVGRRDEVGTQKVGELFGVDAIVFVFAAMNSFEVKGMSQDKSEVGSLAGIGQPVPAKHAFGADGEAVFEGLNEPEEVVEIVVADIGVDQFFALTIHQADVHLVGVQVDSAVEFCGRSVVFHLVS